MSPMVRHDPLSTLVGVTLSNVGGSQSDLILRFINESGEESMPGDAVLVEGVTGLPSKAVFFLNLVPWDDDEDGTAVQVKPWVSFVSLSEHTPFSTFFTRMQFLLH